MEQQLMIRRWIRQSVICRLHSCQATTELTHWSFLYELWFWLARSTSLQSKKIVIHLVNKQHLPKRIYRWGPCFNWGWEAAPKKKKTCWTEGTENHVMDVAQRTNHSEWKPVGTGGPAGWSSISGLSLYLFQETVWQWREPHFTSWVEVFPNVNLIKIGLTAKKIPSAGYRGRGLCAMAESSAQPPGFDPSLASALHVIPSTATCSSLSLTIKQSKSHWCFTHTSHTWSQEIQKNT